MDTAKLRQIVCYAGALLMAAGFVVFEVASVFLTTGMIMVAASAVMHEPVRNIRTWLGSFGGRVMGIFFLLSVLAFFYTDNLDDYLRTISQKTPLVLLPLGLAAFPLSARQVRTVMAVFIGTVCLAGIITLVNYIIHFQEINEQITHSKPIPIITGVNHIHFSLLMALSAILTGYNLVILGVKNRLAKGIQIAALALLIGFLHVISARTGLICFYAAIGVGIVWYVVTTRRYLQGIGAVVTLAMVLGASVMFVPSLKNRVNNTNKDLTHYKQGKEINHFSISMRLESLKMALLLIKENPVVGVGAADLKKEMDRKYTEQGSTLLPENRILPHNQFLLTACSLGISGLLVLISYFLYPVFCRSVLRNMPFMLFLLIVFVSFQVEAVLERQVGIVFASFFYMLLRRREEPEPSQESIPADKSEERSQVVV